MAEADATTTPPAATITESPPGATETPPSGGSTALGDGSPGYVALDWRSDLSPDLQAAPWLKDHTSKESAIKALGELTSYRGRSIGVPGKDAKPEDWDRVYDRLGRPKDPKDYELESPVGTEGAPWWGEGMDGALRGIAHKVGLNNTQAQRLVQEVAGFLGAGHNRQEAAKVEETGRTQQQLSELWGGAKVQNLRLAQSAIRRFSEGEEGAQLWAFFEESGLGNNIPFIKFLHRVGSLLPEDTYVGDGLGPLPTISELETQIAQANRELFAASDKGDGQALAAAQAKMRGLQQQRAAQQERQAAQRRYVA